MIETRAFQYAAGGGASGLLLAAIIYFLLFDNFLLAGICLFAGLPLLLLTAGVLAGRRIDEAEKRNRELTVGIGHAEEHLGRIAHAAVTGINWDVDIEDSYVPTCWEILDCSAAECPVFRKKNIRCWFVAGTYCGGEVQGSFAQKIGDCNRCDVYQQAVANHPVGYIRETFNNLLWVVDEKTRLIAATNAELQVKYEELEELQAKTQHMAETDALTGLYNYGHFNAHLKHEVLDARRYRKEFSLLMLDFKNFKKINEVYGYHKGDLILKALAEHLRREARPGDYIARYGNEEFVIVLPGMNGRDALNLAEGLSSNIGRVSGSVQMDESELDLRIGVADFPDCAGDSESLIAAADAALYFARKNTTGVAYFCDLVNGQLTASDLESLKSRLQGVGVSTLTALARAVDATDQYRDGDYEALGEIANNMARQLDMDAEEAELLVLAAKIHDIGKIGVPSEVLAKTDKLSPLEVEMVKSHPEIGQEILREARQIQELVLAILYHHERWDGKGYPEGLEGNKIPRMARVIGIFDAYRAMRSDRPYRKALTQQQAVAELRKGAGSQFDPELVEIFIEQLKPDEQQDLRKTG